MDVRTTMLWLTALRHCKNDDAALDLAPRPSILLITAYMRFTLTT
jgi:hypothetical protein